VVYLFIVRSGQFPVKSGVVVELNRRYCNVDVFHFSYLRDQEADKFQNLISSSTSKDTTAVKFSRRSGQ